MYLRNAVGVCAGLTACISLTTYSAQAVPADEGDDTINPSSEVLQVPLSAPLSLSDAQTLAADQPSLDVVGYHYDNGPVVGEFFPDNGSQADFLADFAATYGTQPAVTGFVVVDPDADGESGVSSPLTTAQSRRSTTPSVVATQKSAFKPKAVSKTLLAKLFKPLQLTKAAKLRTAAAAATIAHGTWAPDTVDVKITRSGTTQSIENDITWSASSNNNTPSGWGFEVGIDLLRTKDGDDAKKYGRRGDVYPDKICEVGFRDKFIGKNYDFKSWSATSSSGAVKAGVPYADYNDVFDSCYRNAMTIGFEYPKLIPGDKLITKINAQKGSTNSSYLGGGIQLVHDDCSAFAASAPRTNCMGFYDNNPPASAHSPRPLLNPDRGWIADPTLCWRSASFGGATPSLIGC